MFSSSELKTKTLKFQSGSRLVMTLIDPKVKELIISADEILFEELGDRKCEITHYGLIFDIPIFSLDGGPGADGKKGHEFHGEKGRDGGAGSNGGNGGNGLTMHLPDIHIFANRIEDLQNPGRTNFKNFRLNFPGIDGGNGGKGGKLSTISDDSKKIGSITKKKVNSHKILKML